MWRIAVIDDDASMRDAVVGLVRSLGHAAVAYGSADAFLATRDPGVVSCVIADIHMPGMSGLELAGHFAGRGDRAPVILMTARGQDGLQEQAVASGAHCVLLKPFAADALIACLESALAGRTPAG